MPVDVDEVESILLGYTVAQLSSKQHHVVTDVLTRRGRSRSCRIGFVQAGSWRKLQRYSMAAIGGQPGMHRNLTGGHKRQN